MRFRVPLLLVCALASYATLHAEIRAAAAKVDITPERPQWLQGYAPRKSTGTHDRIYHRVVAVDDGRTQFYLASSDLCCFSPALYDETAALLRQRFGIQPKQFWWAVTHTHSAPEVGPRGMYDALLKGRSDHPWDREYTAEMQAKLIAAVEQAKNKLQPARIAVGTGISWANINRRAKDADGAVSLGLNPEGPVDRQLGLIRFERPDGTPIALLANYAIHGTVLSGKSDVISGDAPGVAAAWVEEKLGAPVLFVNGAAGDTAPIYSVYPDPKSGHLLQFRVLLGDRILQTNSNAAGGSSEVSLHLDESFVETPLRSGIEWPDELARYARKATGGGTVVRLPVRFLRIGDTAIWAAPLELFSQVATGVRNRSPFPHTMYFGYTNGWFGYLPTAAAFSEGGYETRTTPFTPSAASDLQRHVLTFLASVAP